MTPQQAYMAIRQMLLSIVRETMMLEEIEAGLRQSGRTTEADAFDRLMQDVGLELKWAMDVPAEGDATAGPKTIEINTLYTPVTAERLFTFLGEITPLIEQDRLRDTLIELTEEVCAQAYDYTQAQALLQADENSAPTSAHTGVAPALRL